MVRALGATFTACAALAVGAGGQEAAPRQEAAECAAPQPAWLWCDDFETNRFASYFEVDTARGKFVRVPGVGHNGSTGMRARFSVGDVSVGALHLAIGLTPQAYFRPATPSTTRYREVYWRLYLRNQPGWTGGGGHKLSRAFVFSSRTTFAQAMIAHIWAGQPPNQDYLFVEPARGTDAAGTTVVTTRYNDFAKLRFLGPRRGVTPLFSAAGVGRWYCIEARARLNDPGQSNGVQQLWIDGRLEAERHDLNYLGAYSEYGINAVYVENYWNTPGSPAAQERYIDRFVVSTARIGC